MRFRDTLFNAANIPIAIGWAAGFTIIGKEGNTGILSTNSVAPATLKSVVHEHGHALNLSHTFEPPANITLYESKFNYMDYPGRGPDLSNWFGYFQWSFIY